jgi:hypothetical protein
MSAGAARLKHAMKTVNDHWEQTREVWTDRVAQEFEKNHLIPVEQGVENARRGMDKITEIMQKIKQECS